MVCSNNQLPSGQNVLIFGDKTMDYKWVKLSKLDCFDNSELNMPSDRVFSGLSEVHKIMEIGPTELKLWPLKLNSHISRNVCKYFSE